MTALLLTGAPGCGKTTLIRSMLARLQRPAGGFYTQEVRQDGVRVGFEVVMLDGKRGRLAQVALAAKHWVGKYGVDLAFLECKYITFRSLLGGQRELAFFGQIGLQNRYILL